MSVPAPNDIICFFCGGAADSGSERKALMRMSRAVVRV